VNIAEARAFVVSLQEAGLAPFVDAAARQGGS